MRTSFWYDLLTCVYFFLIICVWCIFPFDEAHPWFLIMISLLRALFILKCFVQYWFWRIFSKGKQIVYQHLNFLGGRVDNQHWENWYWDSSPCYMHVQAGDLRWNFEQNSEVCRWVEPSFLFQSQCLGPSVGWTGRYNEYRFSILMHIIKSTLKKLSSLVFSIILQGLC